MLRSFSHKVNVLARARIPSYEDLLLAPGVGLHRGVHLTSAVLSNITPPQHDHTAGRPAVPAPLLERHVPHVSTYDDSPAILVSVP